MCVADSVRLHLVPEPPPEPPPERHVRPWIVQVPPSSHYLHWHRCSAPQVLLPHGSAPGQLRSDCFALEVPHKEPQPALAQHGAQCG